MNAQLRPFLDSRFESMVDLVTEIVRTESPTSDKAGVDAVGAIVQRELRVLGADVRTFAQTTVGDHTLGVFNRGAGAPIAMILHVDTVHPLGSFAPRYKRENGRLYGPGIFDMKASSVITLYALRALQELGVFPQREIRVLFTSDEEIGSGTSKDLIIEQAQGAALVMVMEPALADGRLKSSRRAVGHFVLLVHGRAAHAGLEPEKGVNALVEASSQVLVIDRFGRPDRGTTVTPTVSSSGTADNVVPAEAKVLVDVRVVEADERARVEAAFAALVPSNPDARLEIRGGFNRPPMPPTASAWLFPLAVEVAESLRLPTIEGVAVGGGSDGNFTAAAGVPTLDGMGAVGGGAHADHEWIAVDRMADRALLVAGVVARLQAR